MTTGLKGEERRQEVVAKAAELFDATSYHTTSMSELARAVGIEKPTLYHYFSSKDEILFWIHEQFIDHLLEKTNARADLGLTASDELAGAMEDILELMDTHRGHVRVFFEHHRELTPARQTTIRDKRDLYQGIIQAIVERGIADGEFRKVDPRLTALAIFGMCNWSYQWYQPGGARTSSEIAAFLGDLLLDGLSTPS
jgi:AcrR family transcriptional regulator